MLAIGALATGSAAALAAVVSALGSPAATVAAAEAASGTTDSRTISFPGARVVARTRPGGLSCFTVARGTSTIGRSCHARLRAEEIAYVTSRHAVGGLAGTEVRAVIVKLTRKGTVWATLRRGAFYAVVPKGREVRAVVKVLRDGSRRRFPVTTSR
jgi:hypothetical protein